MSLEKTLIEYGLKEKEARVYIAALEVSSGPVLKIAEKAGLARSTTELLLKNLKEKGLVSSFKRKTVNWYTAEDPRRIVVNLKLKAELIEESLPKLSAIYASSLSRPTVRFYEGKQGIKLILEEILKEAREILGFGSAEDLFETVESFPTFVEKRVKARIPVKLILPDSEKARERQKLGPSQLREVRIIKEEYRNHGVIYVWANKIALFSLKKDINAVLIESEELAQVERAIFMALWDKLD